MLCSAGLQANRELPGLPTIEGVLEPAIFKAGMIAEANFGDFRKTKWSRSSRTDKGVHSLATVIGLRILMDEEDYETGWHHEGVVSYIPSGPHVPAVLGSIQLLLHVMLCGQPLLHMANSMCVHGVVMWCTCCHTSRSEYCSCST